IQRRRSFLHGRDRSRKNADRDSELRRASDSRTDGATFRRSIGRLSCRLGMSSHRTRIGSGAVIVLLAVLLWGFVVGPMIATFGQSITGVGGGFAEYATFFDFRGGAQGE